MRWLYHWVARRWLVLPHETSAAWSAGVAALVADYCEETT